jgi:arginine-tRNA-protein transferase
MHTHAHADYNITTVASPIPLQVLSHYPSHPSPVELPLFDSGDGPCPYHPGRTMRTLAFLTRRMSGELYHEFMDAGFRRSGEVFYQPICPRCRDCTPLRVPVADFLPSKSQRRVWRRNEDLQVTVQAPELTQQKFDLYRQYLVGKHHREESSYADLERFLYRSPVDTLEMEYRLASGELVGVSLLDVCSRSLSSVYMYYSPEHSKRSLGVFSALYEIAWAKRQGIPYYYLGYWVKDCRTMSYKSDYLPYEILRTDGLWKR